MKPAHLLGWAAAPVVLALVVGGIGCAVPTKQVKTPRYVMTVPETWKVVAQGHSDGQATTVLIGGDGMSSAPAPGADDGRPFAVMESEVEVRIYGWSASVLPPGEVMPIRSDAEPPATAMVARLLVGDEALQLRRHVLTSTEQQVECGQSPRSYRLFQTEREALDVISQPGWRAVIVGARAQGSLLGVVARVPNEVDRGLYCHNLGNLQLRLQRLLDGLQMLPAPAYVPPPPSLEPSLDTKPTLDF